MRMLQKNKQKMYYANQDRIVPVYETYIDDDGNEYQLDTGETKIMYGEPVEFFGNIALSGGEAEAKEYGIDVSEYSAILVLPKGMLPLNETSLVWHTTEPTTDINGNTDEYSADYKVVKVSPSINVNKYVLQKVVK